MVVVARALTEPVTASRDVHVALADGLQTRVARVLEVRHGGGPRRARVTASWTLSASCEAKQSQLSSSRAGTLGLVTGAHNFSMSQFGKNHRLDA